MTLNDFKSVEGDTQTGIRSLPVILGVGRAAGLACWVMALPQVVVIALLLHWGAPLHAAGVVAVLAAQLALMPRFLGAPRAQAIWYNSTRHDALCGRNAGSRIRIAGHGMSSLSWAGIARLGLVQMALGSVVVLVTSTLNRVMVVEFALPAILPGALVALHYCVQVLRPRMGWGSDMAVGARRGSSAGSPRWRSARWWPQSAPV